MRGEMIWDSVGQEVGPRDPGRWDWAGGGTFRILVISCKGRQFAKYPNFIHVDCRGVAAAVTEEHRL